MTPAFNLPIDAPAARISATPLAFAVGLVASLVLSVAPALILA